MVNRVISSPLLKSVVNRIQQINFTNTNIVDIECRTLSFLHRCMYDCTCLS